MAREDRFISFIIAHTSKSRARVQRIRVEKKSVTVFVTAAAVLAICLVYGLYGLTQQAAHLCTELENQRLRAENERQRQELEVRRENSRPSPQQRNPRQNQTVIRAWWNWGLEI